MKFGSVILALVLLFGATFYVLGSLTTNASHIQAELREIQARNQQLEAQLQQQSQICQRDIQALGQNARQLQEKIHSQQAELALLQQSLDAERAASVEAEQPVETLITQSVDLPRPSLTQNNAMWFLAKPTSEYIGNWAKAILTSSLIVLVLVSGYSARRYGKVKLHRLQRFLNRSEAATADEQNLVWVRMTRKQCQEFRKWRHDNHRQQYLTGLSESEQSTSN